MAYDPVRERIVIFGGFSGPRRNDTWAFACEDVCRADFDGDGQLTLFDFLTFQNEFDAGCE